MSENIKQKTVLSCWIIFAILIFVHGFEAIVLRMDETVLGENCIATNLLHVITDTGTDDMMIVRVIIAQLLSFAVVIAVWLKRKSA